MPTTPPTLTDADLLRICGEFEGHPIEEDESDYLIPSQECTAAEADRFRRFRAAGLASRAAVLADDLRQLPLRFGQASPRVKRLACPCPTHCRYCGTRRRRDTVGHYCPRKNCQWSHGYSCCTLYRSTEPEEQS